MNPFDVNLQYGMLYSWVCFGFVPVFIVAVLYVLYDVVTMNSAPDDTDVAISDLRDKGDHYRGPATLDYATPRPPRRFRVSCSYRLPRRKVLMIASLPFLFYAVPAIIYIWDFNQANYTTIHFIDSLTGQPVTDSAIVEAFDYADEFLFNDADRYSPPLGVTQNPSGVLKVKWYHGETFYICFSQSRNDNISIRGFGAWTTHFDDYPQEIWAMVTRGPATAPAIPTNTPATVPSAGHI